MVKNPISNLEAALAACKGSNRILVRIPTLSLKAALAAFQSFHKVLEKNPISMLKDAFAPNAISNLKAALAAFRCFHNGFGQRTYISWKVPCLPPNAPFGSR